MALTQSDFLLTDEELNKINRYFSAMAESQAEVGEDAPQIVSVTFEFTTVLGRTVIANFNSALNGRPISDGSEGQLTETTVGEAQKSTVNESGEQRLAKHGFFISEDIQGSSEADELANTFADIIKSMQEGKPDKG